jgi:hypothetical protein
MPYGSSRMPAKSPGIGDPDVVRSARAAGVVLAAGMSLLAGGCVEHVEDNIVIGYVEVTFTTHVTGRAIVRWSDGVDTHAMEVNASGEQTWKATVGQNQFVAAMTAVPVGKGSKASCAIDKGDGAGRREADTYADEAAAPGRVAVCIVAGQVDEAQPEGARTITVVPTSEKGDARYRVATRNGGAFVDDLAGGELDERQFTVVGPVTMVVVAQDADDVIGCRISDANGDLSVQSAMGLGAIVGCHSFVAT